MRETGNFFRFIIVSIIVLSGIHTAALSETADNVVITPLPNEPAAWANNSVNAVIFRKDPIASHGDTQYIAYYDETGEVILGRRTLGTANWDIRRTGYTGNTKDAHNAICIAVDGAGYLHMAWDHHGHDLNYVRSMAPGSLDLTERLSMTGKDEERVTYPEFFNLPDGDLLFLYRVGSSGNGRTMLNRYDVEKGAWNIVKHPLIDGEGLRNAYTNQIAVDSNGGWHISWCWRETGGVQTNHDICYAVTRDGGRTWQTSGGKTYDLPITEATAECIVPIPQNSELINHTSMTVTPDGRPVIATYWRPEGTTVPQFHAVWRDGGSWKVTQIGRRTTPFSLSGAGTKRIPISRPKVFADKNGRVIVIFRDEERGFRVSAAVTDRLDGGDWRIMDLSDTDVGLWEPSYDTALWAREGIIHLYVHKVGQGDGETLDIVDPQHVKVYEWKP